MAEAKHATPEVRERVDKAVTSVLSGLEQLRTGDTKDIGGSFLLYEYVKLEQCWAILSSVILLLPLIMERLGTRLLQSSTARVALGDRI